MTSFCVVLITASNLKEAEKISQILVREKLAACVNLVPKISSRYWWQGKVETASESLLIVKTKKGSLKKLIQRVKSVHSYTVPEVIALPIVQGNKNYLDWIHASI